MGISKGLAMSRIINSIAERVGMDAVQYDFVLVAGHFLARDENIFTFFEGQSLKVRMHSPPPSARCGQGCLLPSNLLLKMTGLRRIHLAITLHGRVHDYKRPLSCFLCCTD